MYFLFLLNDIVGLLTDTLRNYGLICRMRYFFLMTVDMFEWVLLYINTSVVLVVVTFFIIFNFFSFTQVNLAYLFIQMIFITFSLQKFLFHNCAVTLVLILCRIHSF